MSRLTSKESTETKEELFSRSLQNKISLSSLNYDEMETIAEMLGYEIVIRKIK